MLQIAILKMELLRLPQLLRLPLLRSQPVCLVSPEQLLLFPPKPKSSERLSPRFLQLS